MMKILKTQSPTVAFAKGPPIHGRAFRMKMLPKFGGLKPMVCNTNRSRNGLVFIGAMRKKSFLAKCGISLLPLALAACGGLAGSPPRADIKALTEQKPSPTDDIATDPVAEARYNVAVESWGERLSSAGARLCRFFAAQGVKDLDCPEPKLSGE